MRVSLFVIITELLSRSITGGNRSITGGNNNGRRTRMT